MTLKENHKQVDRGNIVTPIYYDVGLGADVNVNGDVCLYPRLYTYETDSGLVAGWTMNVMATIDRPARDVWAYFKDFNRWQKDHYYSGVVGDLEGKTLSLGDSPNEAESSPYRFQVLKVIPEYTIILIMLPLPKDNMPGLPGLVGGRDPGFGVFTLNEHGGRTVVSVFMEHGAYASRTKDMATEEALAPWRDPSNAPEWQRKWRDDFIPALKKLVYEGI